MRDRKTICALPAISSQAHRPLAVLCSRAPALGSAMANSSGSADALSGKSWVEREKHCLHAGPTWLYVVILLQSLLALWVTEALNLQGLRSRIAIGVVILEQQPM